MARQNFHKLTVTLTLCLSAIPIFAQTNANGWAIQDGGVIRGPISEKKIALVFTGDNFAESGDAILSELAKHNAKASFFLTGNFLTNAEFAPLVRRMIAQGDYIGPHSDKHLLFCDWNSPPKTLATRDTFHADIDANLDKLAAFGITRAEARFFLPAYEHFNGDIARWTAQMGLTPVDFTPGTRANADYTSEAGRNFVSSSAIFGSIVRREREGPNGLNGFILLLHIGSGPGRADKFSDRFGELLDYLTEHGYQCARIDELLAAPDSIYIRANQVGYDLSEPKTAIAFSRAPLPKSFSVANAESEKVVFTGHAKPIRGAVWGQFTNHVELDFSSLTNSGNYFIQYGDAVSLPFAIKSQPLARLPEELLEFVREQRCGYNPWLGTNCHQLDGRTAYGPLPYGTHIDVTGGWHDAGDTLKYLVTSETATADMLLAYKLALHRSAGFQTCRIADFQIGKSHDRERAAGLETRDTADSEVCATPFADHVDALGNPGSNGIPDILDEAHWGLD